MVSKSMRVRSISASQCIELFSPRKYLRIWLRIESHSLKSR